MAEPVTKDTKEESYTTEMGGGNLYTDFFLPMVLSMSTNNPLQFWKLRYNQVSHLAKVTRRKKKHLSAVSLLKSNWSVT